MVIDENSQAFNAVECADCKVIFYPKSKRSKRCPECQKKRNKESVSLSNKRNREYYARRYKNMGYGWKREQEMAAERLRPKRAPKVTLEQAVQICMEHNVSYGKAITMGLFE